MKKEYKNKQMKAEKTENKTVKIPFFFPQYQITINASSLEVARQMLEEQLKVKEDK